jgi:hypothetical protein
VAASATAIGAMVTSSGSTVIGIDPSAAASLKRNRVVLPAGSEAFSDSLYEMND